MRLNNNEEFMPFTPPNMIPSAVDPQGFPEFEPPDATGPNIIDPRLLYRDKADGPSDGGLQGINPEDFPEWAGGTITLENFEEFIEYLLGGICIRESGPSRQSEY